MRRWLAIVLSAWIAAAGLAAAAPLAAQPSTPGTIPRTYPELSNERADPMKPADQFAREAALAEGSEAACNAGGLRACADLGRAFQRGEGRPQNRPIAELLYRRACNAKVGEGCFALSQLIKTTEEDGNTAFAAIFAEQACRLGTLPACAAEADALEGGVFGPPDPQAAEMLRRATCAKGERSACLALANTLLGRDRSEAEIAEGRALIDRQCRAGDAAACSDAGEHWRLLIGMDSQARMAEYRALACDAGGAGDCAQLGEQVLRTGNGPAQQAQALAYYERACAGDSTFCGFADELRDQPLLERGCDSGDSAACIALGKLLAKRDAPDRARALALLGAACDAGGDDACSHAARLMVKQGSVGGDLFDPAAYDRYLSRSCEADGLLACDQLAFELESGTFLPQDQTRAAMLYTALCDAGNVTACTAMEERGETDPAAPLMLANAQFGPELTPEEVQDDARLAREARERARAEARARDCTTTTVIFEGVSYTDVICDLSTVRVIGNGFTVRPGQTPWQALLWRPATRGRQQLSLQQRVLCGGSVIREGWVLTAAHCVNDKHLGGVSITTGGHVIRLGLTNALGDEGFSYPIIATFRHPDYDPDGLAFDIALVQYDPGRGKRGSKALAPARVRLDPVPLAARKVEALPRVSTYGWGLTAFQNGVIPDQLRGGRVKLRDAASCTAEIVSFAERKRRVTDPARRFDGPVRRDSVLCADEGQGADGGQACSGDSGGPLISYSDTDKVPTLIGVVSGGVFCGTTGRPSRYIRVAHPRVQRWLKATLPSARSR